MLTELVRLIYISPPQQIVQNKNFAYKPTFTVQYEKIQLAISLQPFDQETEAGMTVSLQHQRLLSLVDAALCGAAKFLRYLFFTLIT